MKIIDVAVGACAVVLVAACGGTSNSSNATPASSSEVVQYKQLALQVQSAAGTYGQTMAGIPTLAACQRLEVQYDGQVRPWISQMMGMSGGMDSLVSDHDGAMNADMGCDADAMMRELDSHRSMACASADMATDRTEAARHVQAMTGYASHGVQRCDEMLSGLNGGSWSWSPMMSGCQTAAAEEWCRAAA